MDPVLHPTANGRGLETEMHKRQIQVTRMDARCVGLFSETEPALRFYGKTG
jgi:hypothetical protein